VDPGAGLEAVERRKFFTLPGLELRLLSRPARSQSLHRIRYSPKRWYPPAIPQDITTQKFQSE
jgi:hypothetical protein